ncbi:MAG: HPF/RaiA family ribosome-associated protein [Patescibacteria group bacterium]
MKIDIKYTQFQPADNIEEYARKRIGSLARFLKSFEKNHEITTFVEIARSTRHHRKGNVFYAEAMFESVPGGKKFRAESTGLDIREAIDEVKEKLKKEIRRYKDKLVNIRRKT